MEIDLNSLIQAYTESLNNFDINYQVLFETYNGFDRLMYHVEFFDVSNFTYVLAPLSCDCPVDIFWARVNVINILLEKMQDLYSALDSGSVEIEDNLRRIRRIDQNFSDEGFKACLAKFDEIHETMPIGYRAITLTELTNRAFLITR